MYTGQVCVSDSKGCSQESPLQLLTLNSVPRASLSQLTLKSQATDSFLKHFHFSPPTPNMHSLPPGHRGSLRFGSCYGLVEGCSGSVFIPSANREALQGGVEFPEDVWKYKGHVYQWTQSNLPKPFLLFFCHRDTYIAQAIPNW